MATQSTVGGPQGANGVRPPALSRDTESLLRCPIANLLERANRGTAGERFKFARQLQAAAVDLERCPAVGFDPLRVIARALRELANLATLRAAEQARADAQKAAMALEQAAADSAAELEQRQTVARGFVPLRKPALVAGTDVEGGAA